VTARFSKDRRFRYRLEVTRKPKLAKGKTACVVMQNPSYAGKDVADKSVQFMEKVVFEKGLPEFLGVKRLIVVNLFARIQTNDFEGRRDDIGASNDSAIRAAVREADIIIFGWGAGNRFKERKEFILGMLPQMSGKHLYKTAKHPSRGRYDGFIQPYGILRS